MRSCDAGLGLLIWSPANLPWTARVTSELFHVCSLLPPWLYALAVGCWPVVTERSKSIRICVASRWHSVRRSLEEMPRAII